MRGFYVVAICALLGGCAGSDTHLRMLENSNALQVEPSQAPGYDYVVRMKNVVDVGYDPDNPETRKSTALHAIQVQCPKASIVGEQVIDKGTYAIGRSAREYFIQIKCDGSALPPAMTSSRAAISPRS